MKDTEMTYGYLKCMYSEVFPIRIYLLVGNFKRCKSKLISAIKDKNQKAVYKKHICSPKADEEGYNVLDVIWIRNTRLEYLVHELTHVLFGEFKRLNLPLTSSSDETFAYTLMYFFEMSAKFLKEVEKKIKKQNNKKRKSRNNKVKYD